MHVELVAPGLLAAAQGARLPCAELLLARGRANRVQRVSVERWLQEAFGLEGGGLPAGALTALARGEAAEGLLARADPVHLQLMREHIAVVPGAALAVSREEADALAAAINDHFAGRLEVHVFDPVRWWARLAEPIELGAEGPLAHAGRALRPGTAGDALMNEIQMLLHAHPVNEAREARGEAPVNGLWLWGGGAAPKDVQPRWQSVTADDPVALGLAQAAKSRGRALPASADAWLARLPEDGRQLVLLDGLRQAAHSPIALEQAWFAPLLAALRDGRIGMLTVHVPDSGVSFETIRGDMRRFWRRRRPLASYQE